VLGALTAALHLEVDALERKGFVEGGAGPGAVGQSGGKEQGSGGELGEKALQGDKRPGHETLIN